MTKHLHKVDDADLFRALIEATPDIIMLVGPDERIRYINHTVKGLSHEQAIGTTPFDWVPAEHHEQMRKAQRRAFETGQATSYEIQGHGDHGAMTWWSTTAGPIIERGDVIAIALISRDITKRKQAERAAEEAQQQLEERVAQRTAHLNEEIARRVELEEELRQIADIKRAFAAEVIKHQEHERARVAREIHDAIGQVLFALRMDADWICAHASDASAVATGAERMSRMLSGAIETVRNVVCDLRPSSLDDIGVCGALESYAHQIARGERIEVKTAVVADESRAAAEATTAAFRIGQEAINNAIRHAKATRVEISFEDTGEELFLEVRDDGQGIPAAKREAHTSLGLLGMRERASIVGGMLYIDSQEGKGTSIRVRIPCSP